MHPKCKSLLTALLAMCLCLAACAGAPTAVPEVTAGPLATSAAPTTGPVRLDWTPILVDFLSSMPADSYLITPSDLEAQIQSGKAPFIVDVRDPSEIGQMGYIQGAVNIPLRDLLQNLDKLPGLDAPIVVHCSIGHRGAMAMTALRLVGYTDVLSLDGGFAGWTDANLPVESGTPPAPLAGTAAAVDPTRLASLNHYLTTLPADFYGNTDSSVLKAINSGTPPMILDVRTPTEVAASGSIANSTFIPLAGLLSDPNRLPADKDASIFTISSDGQNGSVAAMALRLIGYTHVFSMYFGFNAWVADRFPVQK